MRERYEPTVRVAVVEEADDGVPDAAASVIAVHLNELDLQGGGSQRRHVGVTIDSHLVVQLNPRDLDIVLHEAQKDMLRAGRNGILVPPLGSESEASFLVREGEPMPLTFRTFEFHQSEAHAVILPDHTSRRPYRQRAN